MQVLLSKDMPDRDRASLQSALGRILLQLGDVFAADKQFQALRQW